MAETTSGSVKVLACPSGLDVVQAVCYVVGFHIVFVEVLVQGTRCVEQAADIAVAGFGPEPADDPVVVAGGGCAPSRAVRRWP